MNTKSELPTTLCDSTIDGSVCILMKEHSGGHHWAEGSINLASALGVPKGRYDRVLAAYDGMSVDDKNTFRDIIRDEEFSHAQVASALREIGYDVDRKQVHQFREKLALGRVTL